MKDNQTYREDEGSATDRNNAGKSRQPSQNLDPQEGADGFVGSNTGPTLGIKVIQGKNPTIESRSVDSIQRSSGENQDTAAPSPLRFEGQDSTDEKASYKDIQMERGLPRTFRNANGAGDAGPTDSDEADNYTGSPDLQKPDTQKIGSEMPQTKYTDEDGGGAPKFKVSR
jgi:hypothetical protein